MNPEIRNLSRMIGYNDEPKALESPKASSEKSKGEVSKEPGRPDLT